ncbi:MAG: alpha/beta fold hydrolase [Solirubrobacteraceae bacterium]
MSRWSGSGGASCWRVRTCTACGCRCFLIAPTVLLHGARDARTPPLAVQALAERLPAAGLIEFVHAGHDLLRMRSGAMTAIAAAMARGGLQNALATGERVRHHRPRGRLLELYERRLNRRAANA